MTNHVVTLVTDHFQFLVGDSVEAPLQDTSNLWDSNEAVAALPGCRFLVGIATARYGGMQTVTVIESATQSDSWAEAVRMGSFELDLPSRKLVLWAPETVNLAQSPSLALPGDAYVGEVYSRNADRVDDEMSLDGPDEYVLVLSPR